MRPRVTFNFGVFSCVLLLLWPAQHSIVVFLYRLLDPLLFSFFISG
jgi:hypothetical protein